MNKIFLLIVVFVFTCNFINAQVSTNEKFSQIYIPFYKHMSDEIYNVNNYTVKDFDGKQYKVLKIGANANKNVVYLLCERLEINTNYIVKMRNLTDESGVLITEKESVLVIRTKK